jgi:putative hydrolase of the HAD superfamily
MIKALLLDLDQTLLDRTATFRAYLERQYDDLNLSEQNVTKMEYFAEVDRWDDNGYRDKLDTFSRTAENLNFSLPPKELMAHFKTEYGQDAQLFPGVESCLQQWSQRLPLALVTNGRTDGQSSKLKVTGIEDYFSAIVISESVGIKKPDPEIYFTACRALAVEPGQVVFVGDHPKNDVEVPASLGMKGIWVRNEVYAPPVVHHGILESVTDLESLIHF